MKLETFKCDQTNNKWTILLVLVVMNTFLIIASKSCSLLTDMDMPFLSITTVLYTEIIKCVVSISLCYYFDTKCNINELRYILFKAFLRDNEVFKLILPSLLYVLQNNFQYLIESTPAFQVMYQMKIITTALFYTSMLNKKHSDDAVITKKEWFCIIFLAIGVGLIQVSQSNFKIMEVSPTVGVVSVIGAVLFSGYAGISLENTIKSSSSSIWLLNIQLSSISCVLCTTLFLFSKDWGVGETPYLHYYYQHHLHYDAEPWSGNTFLNGLNSSFLGFNGSLGAYWEFGSGMHDHKAVRTGSKSNRSDMSPSLAAYNYSNFSGISNRPVYDVLLDVGTLVKDKLQAQLPPPYSMNASQLYHDQVGYFNNFNVLHDSYNAWRGGTWFMNNSYSNRTSTVANDTLDVEFLVSNSSYLHSNSDHEVPITVPVPESFISGPSTAISSVAFDQGIPNQNGLGNIEEKSAIDVNVEVDQYGADRKLEESNPFSAPDESVNSVSSFTTSTSSSVDSNTKSKMKARTKKLKQEGFEKHHQQINKMHQEHSHELGKSNKKQKYRERVKNGEEKGMSHKNGAMKWHDDGELDTEADTGEGNESNIDLAITKHVEESGNDDARVDPLHTPTMHPTIPLMSEILPVLPIHHYYDMFIYVVIALQAFSGILNAAVIRYSDTIHKVFGVSISIILASIIYSNIIFPHSVPLNATFFSGSLIVLMSTTVFIAISMKKKSIEFMPYKMVHSRSGTDLEQREGVPDDDHVSIAGAHHNSAIGTGTGMTSLLNTPSKTVHNRQYANNLVSEIDLEFPYNTPPVGNTYGSTVGNSSSNIQSKTGRLHTTHSHHHRQVPPKNSVYGYGYGIRDEANRHVL